MEKVFEAYLELNKQLMMQNMRSDYEITLNKDDFKRLAEFMQIKFRPAIVIDNQQSLNDCEWFKMAGPGGYITFHKKKSEIMNQAKGDV